jgi:hypothetical protein
MADPKNLVWTDGFDQYTAISGQAGALSECYITASGSIITNTALTRFTYGQCISAPIIGRELNGSTGYDVVTAGFAAYLQGDQYVYGTANPTLWQLTDTSLNILCTVIYDGINNRIYFCDSTFAAGNAIEGNPPGDPSSDPGLIEFWSVPNQQEWYWFDITWAKGTSATTGTFACNINGVPAVNRSNVNMGTSNAVQWAIGGYIAVLAPWYLDDLYIRKDAVMLGDSRVFVLEPDADTAQKDWTANSGTSNYAMVDEALSDGDNTFVYSATAGAADLYTMNATMPFVPSVFHGVKVNAVMRKDLTVANSVGNRTSTTLLESNGVVANGAIFGLSQSYNYVSDVYGVDPNTGSAWTADGIANATIGMKIVS